VTIPETVREGEHIGLEELQIRRDLAACYRLVAYFGWDDLINTHISARVPGADHFLLNPYGLVFEQITASSLIKVNFEGEVLSPSTYDVNPGGLIIHSAIHMARADTGCVLHLHGPDGAAVSSLEHGLLPLNQTAMTIMNDISFHDFDGIAVSPADGPRLQSDLGDKNIMILRNHGTLTVGQTVASAFVRAYWVEWCSGVQLATLGAGSPVHQPSAEALMATAGQITPSWVEHFATTRVWDAMIRKLDRMGSDFRS
jgi:ribulose-5-phosphate 4-epimerase/fuculose-1-phosphate aldolase